MRALKSDTEVFIRTLPKTETHLHMEGAVPLEMVQRRMPGRFESKPEFWQAHYRFESFEVFSNLFAEVAGAVFVDADAYAECAVKVFADLVSQNCRYVETSIALGALVRSELDGRAVVQSILDAAPSGLDVRVFIGMRHNEYVGLGMEILEDALTWQSLTGFDLHGPEYLPLEPWTADLWQRARAVGKFNKAHAGEFMPAAFVKRCVTELGVSRIEHGVRAIEDPEVVAFLVEQGVTLDICPISNLKLAVEGVNQMSQHPIRQLFDAGVHCTINTDDPFFFGNRLVDEYAALYQHLSFEKDDLQKIAEYGFACRVP